MKLRKIVSVSALLTLTILSGCDPDRLGQFSAFAAAGSLYVSSLHQVIAQAGSAMIAADSASLITARRDADASPQPVQQNLPKYRQVVVNDD